MSRKLYEQDVVRRILALREDLVRHDENAAALALMTKCIPFFALDHPEIARQRDDQIAMCRHLIEPEAYAGYYSQNVHERPMEEQYPGATVDNAHEVFHRVAFLCEGLARQGNNLRVLDVSCNDGWMAANLALAGICCDGIDLNPGCIERAKVRAGRSDMGCIGEFAVGDFVTLPPPPEEYASVVCFETIEHVADPDAAMEALVRMCWVAGRIYVSTPNGVDHGGDLPNWDHVEPKGHVRVFVPKTFHELLSRHGTVERMEQGPDGVMVAEVSV